MPQGPQGSPQSSPVSNTSTNLYQETLRPPSGGPGDGHEVDNSPNFEQMFGEVSESNKRLEGQNRELSQGLSHLKKDVEGSREFQQRIMEAVNPESARQQTSEFDSKISAIDEQIEYWAQYGFTEEGKKIKHTVLNKVQNLELQRALEIEKETNKRERVALKEQVDALSNPQLTIDRQMYANMDNMVLSVLDKLYPGTQYRGAHEAQRQAIQTLAVQYLAEIKAKHPDFMQKMRRDNREVAKFINRVIESTLPPSIVNRLKEDKIQSEPISTNEVLRGIDVARQTIEDPDLRAEVITTLRQKFWELDWAKNKRRG